MSTPHHLDPNIEGPTDDVVDLAREEEAGLTWPPLNYDEDEELRHLHHLAQMEALTAANAERFIQLRLRDRRGEIRAPRGFIIEERPQPRRSRWRDLFRR